MRNSITCSCLTSKRVRDAFKRLEWHDNGLWIRYMVLFLIAPPSLVAHEWRCSACMQRCYQHVFMIILSAHRCIARGTGRVCQHISWRMLTLKLTGVLPACFQVNQVKMSFQTIDYESINNWFNNSNECIVFIDYHSMM